MASLRQYIGDDLYSEVEQFADQNQMRLSVTMRRALRLGLAILRAQKSGQTILVQDGEEVNKLTIL